MDKKLVEYLRDNILPSYEQNDKGHQIDHIMYVIDRSLKFAKMAEENGENIDYNMVYTIAAYHDIGHYINSKKHEEISGKMLLNNGDLKQFFDDEKIKIMSEAIIDHRASLEYEPRSIYGKIVSSADRNTTIETTLRRTYEYRIKNDSKKPIDQIINSSRQHLLDKFGKEGYAVSKMYFKDEGYQKYLSKLQTIISDPKLFREKFLEVNGLEK